MTRRLPRHGLNYCQEVFRSMRQLAQQQSQMGFALLALGHINGRAGQTNDIPRFVAQRFNVQVVPTYSGRVFERDFYPLGLTAREHFVLYRNHGGTRVRRQNLRVGATENVLDCSTEHWIADRGVTQIAVLGVDGHL